MTTLSWSHPAPLGLSGYRLDVINPDTGAGLFGIDLPSVQTSIDTSLFGIPGGTGYVAQVQAYVMDGSTRVYSPLSNRIYVKEAIIYE